MKPKTKKKKSLFRVSCFTFHERGFTLMESIVAIGIFTVGISVCINLISSALVNAGTRTRDKIIAGYLTQEGVEAVRSIRDNNWISGSTDWLAGITTCTTAGCAQTNGCIAWDSSSIDFTQGCVNNLVFDASASPVPAYVQTSGASQFSRVVGVTMLSSDEIQVTATSTCGTNCSVSLSEHLYNWK